MFVRQVSAHYKPGKLDLLGKTLEKEVIPLLKKQAGFRDELSFFDVNKNEAIAMSIWNTEHDADKYAKEVYPAVHEKMRDMLSGKPDIRSFEVSNSTWYDKHTA